MGCKPKNHNIYLENEAELLMKRVKSEWESEFYDRNSFEGWETKNTDEYQPCTEMIAPFFL